MVETWKKFTFIALIFFAPTVFGEICGGSSTFNFSNNNGYHSIGVGPNLQFQTRWGRRSATSLYAGGRALYQAEDYKMAVAYDVEQVSEISQASSYSTQRSRLWLLLMSAMDPLFG